MIFPEIDGDLSLDEMSCILPIAQTQPMLQYVLYIANISGA
jgi:hypothetical protein